MPLVHIHQIAPGVQLGLWALSEKSPADILVEPGPELQLRLQTLGSPRRRLEVAATHALLWQMTPGERLLISHDEAGKPLLENRKISVSHTRGMVALMLSEDKEVALDVEYINGRVDKIASHFLLPEEQQATQNTLDRLEHWCAKETAYKYFSASHLGSSQMRVRKTGRTGQQLSVDNLKDGVSLHVSCIVSEGYVLAYAVAQQGRQN